MPKGLDIRINIDPVKSILSSKAQIYKTELFVKKTSGFSCIDKFISKLAGGIISYLSQINNFLNTNPITELDCFKIETGDKIHTFFVKLGVQTPSDRPLKKEDIVFYDYQDGENLKRRNDQRLVYFLNQKSLNILLQSHKDFVDKNQFKKLYVLSNEDGVNFPLLNHEQRKIVEIEDQNTLVQGVAGSGKTNICINKIIFAATRDYKGKILYNTFSRGLLVDTHNKVQTFRQNLIDFINDYKEGRIIFVDKDYKRAVENYLGILFTVDDRDKIVEKCQKIVNFLDEKVDYLLLEDMYKLYVNKDIKTVKEKYFIKKYVKNIKNHQLKGKLNIVKHLSLEVIYKEIYGMILGCYDMQNPRDIMSLKEYINNRKDSFSQRECEIIYSIALDYKNHLKEHNLWDNNRVSKALLALDSMQKYSLAIIDEAQDMTQVSLSLMKKLSIKMFCVGDALQMINPTYFSFAYLKRLLYQKDIVTVAELSNNYRNTKKIVDIIDKLGSINIKQFGTHSFVLKGKSVDYDINTSAIYVKDNNFLNAVSKQNFEDFTVVVSNQKQKEKLREMLTKQEILTVSEIKGLERDTVILYNILSDNFDKWQRLKKTLINRKTADENSVYRYYFNLFYVGVSRAKSYLYVAEDKNIDLFEGLFKENFDIMNTQKAMKSLTSVVSKVIDQDELLERIAEFIKHGQYDNARFAVNKILDDVQRNYQLEKTDIYENYIQHGKYRDAGIKFWQGGHIKDAINQFKLSGDEILIELIEMCSTQEDNKALDIDILQFYLDIEQNEAARKLVLEAVEHDFNKIKDNQKDINLQFKKIKERIYG